MLSLVLCVFERTTGFQFSMRCQVPLPNLMFTTSFRLLTLLSLLPSSASIMSTSDGVVKMVPSFLCLLDLLLTEEYLVDETGDFAYVLGWVKWHL